MIFPRRIAGYVQGEKTSEGFERMKRRGIVLPPFQVEQNTAKAIRLEFDKMLAKIESITISKSLQTGVAVADAEPAPIAPDALIQILRKEIKQWQDARVDPWTKYFTTMLKKQLAEAQEHFFKDFFEDAPLKLVNRVSYALDKNDVFKGKLARLQKGYLNEAIERINGGKSELRKTFIDKMSKWISGEEDDLEGLKGVMEDIRKESLNFSKFFARDQLSRFNAALTVASYQEAGVTHVKWVTVNDKRVRKEHQHRNGQIYPINKIPDRGYNCRCGLTPAKYKELE